MHVAVLAIVALVTWVVTALGGFILLGTWIARGGVRGGSTRFPAALPLGHFALAAAGLVVWIVYVLLDLGALAWIAFVLLLPVAVLGFTMLLRWIPTYRARAASPPGEAPAEQGFPLPIVVGHGLFAVITVVLVLLSALGLFGS